MVARWAQPKYIKMARGRRAWAKPYSMKSSVGPNWANGKIMTDAPDNSAAFLAAEAAAENIRTMNRGRIPDIKEIREDIKDPLFVVPINTPTQRLRMFYNSEHNVFILQWVHWRKGFVKISVKYPTNTRALQVWQEDRVRWRISRKLPSRQ